MENVNTLDYLLKIEEKAASLVNEAQAQADKRIHDNEEKNQASYDERYKEEIKKRNFRLQGEIEEIKKQYQDALDEYRRELSGIKTDNALFSEVLNRCIALAARE